MFYLFTVTFYVVENKYPEDKLVPLHHLVYIGYSHSLSPSSWTISHDIHYKLLTLETSSINGFTESFAMEMITHFLLLFIISLRLYEVSTYSTSPCVRMNKLLL